MTFDPFFAENNKKIHSLVEAKTKINLKFVTVPKMKRISMFFITPKWIPRCQFPLPQSSLLLVGHVKPIEGGGARVNGRLAVKGLRSVGE